MSEKLVLKANNLYYINIGTDKLHALDIERGEDRPDFLVTPARGDEIHTLDSQQSSAKTLCGATVPRGMPTMVTDRIDPPSLCLRCYAALRPYMNVGKVVMEESEVGV